MRDNQGAKSNSHSLPGRATDRVSTAADGGTMWRILARTRIDLIILDLMLPGTYGMDLLKRYRAKSEVRRLAEA